jgi:surfactin synthase thioesterase subunit
LLPEWIDVQPVQLPGRAGRSGEPLATRMDTLLPGLTEGLLPFLDRPFAIFGHSMGALLAYELAHRLQQRMAMPAHLIVAGHSAPHLPQPELAVHHLPDAELLDVLRGYHGTPPEFFANPALVAALLPVIRADFSVNDTYVYRHRAALRCPITVLAGLDDVTTPLGALPEWARHTRAECEIHVLPGGHFFTNTAVGEIAQIIARKLQ